MVGNKSAKSFGLGLEREERVKELILERVRLMWG